MVTKGPPLDYLKIIIYQIPLQLISLHSQNTYDSLPYSNTILLYSNHSIYIVIYPLINSVSSTTPPYVSSYINPYYYQIYYHFSIYSISFLSNSSFILCYSTPLIIIIIIQIFLNYSFLMLYSPRISMQFLVLFTVLAMLYYSDL